MTNQGQSIVAAAEEQSNRLKRQLVASGELIFAENLGLSSQEIEQRLAAGELFYLNLEGMRVYPAFFTDTEIPREDLAAICRMLNPLGGSEKWQFLSRPKHSLNSITPLEVLKTGRLADVELAATRFVLRILDETGH